MDDSREQGIERLMEHVRPRWDRERQERVFARILASIQPEAGHGRRLAAAGNRLPLSHAAR